MEVAAAVAAVELDRRYGRALGCGLNATLRIVVL